VDRAFSTFEIKSIDAEQRIIQGYASTPGLDQQGHSMDPAGAEFTLPLPFLAHHQQDKPIGEVIAADVTPKGIPITVRIAKDTGLDYIETTWKQIKSRLVRGLSIGWKPLEPPTKIDGGWRYTKWMIGEVSAVTIPANIETTIYSVKQFDTAAPSLHQPGTSGTSTLQRVKKDARPMTISEQITQFENTRAAKDAARNALMTKAADEGTTLDQAQTDEYDGLDREIKSIDSHLVRLRDLEKSNLSQATAITTTAKPEQLSALRGGETSTMPVITVKPNVPKGASFARMCMALAAGHGDSYRTLQYAKQWKDSTPEVEQMVEHMWQTKAAVAAGITTDATWAGPLAIRQPLNDFLELLRPRTLLGRIPGLKQVPFNISIPTQTTGGTYAWVGQNKPKPLTKADYATVTLDFNKVAGIIVLSEELVTLSTPSAENLVREEMLAGMSAFLDQQFCDPAVAVSAGINPASITNGAATIASSGVTGAAAKIDLSSRVGVFVTANYDLGQSVWLMNEANAFGIGLSVNGVGNPLFPGFNGTGGGKLMGVDTVISNNVGARVILVHTPSILFADEGGIRIDVSREASVQMDSAPTDTVDATTVYLSLWQRNLVGLKAERIITWKVARATAVTYITTAASYNGS
jgi:HK97 family phage major capsid protein